MPLIKTAEGDRDYPVVFKYGGQLPRPGIWTRLDLPLPHTTNITVEISQVRLYLPETYRWFYFGGTLLQVTDDPDAGRLKQQGLPIPYSPNQDTLLYEIQRCAVNEAPVASIEGTDPIQASGAAGTNVTVPLNGSNSRDPEQFPLETYTWSCGNNSLPQIQGQPIVTCSYRAQSVAVEYEATLVVTDRGATGQIDPVLGTYCDQKASTPAVRKIRISPLQ